MQNILIPLPELMRRTGLRRTKLYELVREGKLSRPVKIGRASRWQSIEVDRFIETQVAERDRAP